MLKNERGSSSLDRFFEDVLAFEASLGACCEWVLHVGDFGVCPDPGRVATAGCRGSPSGCGRHPRGEQMKRSARCIIGL